MMKKLVVGWLLSSGMQYAIAASDPILLLQPPAWSRLEKAIKAVYGEVASLPLNSENSGKLKIYEYLSDAVQADNIGKYFAEAVMAQGLYNLVTANPAYVQIVGDAFYDNCLDGWECVRKKGFTLLVDILEEHNKKIKYNRDPYDLVRWEDTERKGVFEERERMLILAGVLAAHKMDDQILREQSKLVRGIELAQ